MEIVNIENLSVSFNDILVLENVNLKIDKKGFLAIIGPNGGGKTTLLRVILGFIKPSKGKIKVFGENPEQGRKYIGYVPQYPNFDPNFPINVFDVVLMGRWKEPFKRYTEEDKEEVIKVLKELEIENLKDRKIDELSGGQRQRVLLARALVKDPKLLLLDEPTSSIDIYTQKKFYELLNTLKEKISIVIVTHDITAISSYVEKIACLNRKIYYHGEIREGIKKLEETYGCPIEFIFHHNHNEVPHMTLNKHD